MPIMMFGLAKVMKTDRILGLELAADDYMDEAGLIYES